MHIAVVTLFPEMFNAISDYGISGRALRGGLATLGFFNPREYAKDKHRSVDDKPFGGGPGMLMKTEPLLAAIQAARSSVSEQGPSRVVYMSPQGRRIQQSDVVDLAAGQSLILLCGRYQGIDARVIEAEVDEELSLGDFVISGGELAAMALVDALIRLQPRALGDEDSARQDSFAEGLLHCPEYTRPQEIAGRGVPQTLLSGDHEAIRKWRLEHSLGTTWLKRPDLLNGLVLNPEQQELLEQFKSDYRRRQTGPGSAADE